MSGTKKHIDRLFADIFRDFSLLVSNRDMEAIDDKASRLKDEDMPEQEPRGMFSAFEMDVHEEDWQATRKKLNNEKSAMSGDDRMVQGLRDMEMPVLPEDWPQTYQKYRAAGRRRIAYWWWSSAGVIVLVLGAVFFDMVINGAKPRWSVQEDRPVAPKERNVSEKEDLSDNKRREREQAPEEYVKNNPARTGAVMDRPAVSQSLPEPYGARTAQAQELPGNISLVPEVGIASLEKPSDRAPEMARDKVSEADADLPPEEAQTEKTGLQHADSLDNHQASKNDTSKKKSDDPVTLALRPAGLSMYIGLSGQLASTFRHLGRNNDAVYNRIRNSAEKPFAQWTFGMEFGWRKKNSQFSAGVQSTALTWSGSYRYSYRIYDSLPYKDTSGNVIGYFLVRPRDTSIHEDQVIKVNKIQLPFELTHLVKISQRMSMTGTVGGVIGFTTRSEGRKILNPSNHYMYPYQDFRKEERKISFSPSLALGLQYSLSRHWALQGALCGSYNVTGRFASGFPVRDYPYSGGMSLKLMYMIK